MANAGNLFLKLGTLWIFDGILDPRFAYAVAHSLVFFTSYVSHCRYTFDKNFSVRNFYMFTKAVVLIKSLDYGVFYFFVDYVENSISLALAITLVIVVIRYLMLYRVFLYEKRTHNEL